LDTALIFIGSGCLVCLMPLALYLLYLAHLNGRTPPALVPGPWDFGAVLLGLSGFLILAGPLLLTLISAVWRSYAFGGWADLRSVGAREAWAGSLMAVGYLILVGVGIYVLLRSRRKMTAIYNVAPDDVEPTLVGVLDELGYPWKRANGLIEIGVKRLTEPEAAQERFFAHETATVRVDTFPATAHVTLRWGLAWNAVRHEVESALGRSLPSPAKNPVAGWMFTASMAVMVAMLLWLVVLIYIVMTPPPRG
jgi:hypothetical protein